MPSDSVFRSSSVKGSSISIKRLCPIRRPGKLTDLDVNSDGITFKFVGKAGEITKPSSQLTADENFVDAQFFKNRINLNLKGKIFNGDYSTEFYFTDLNDDYAKLNVNSFALNNAQVEPPLEAYTFLDKVLL